MAFSKVILFIVAAGNEGSNLDLGRHCYFTSFDLPNIVSVGSIEADGSRSIFSNYGSMVRQWERGIDVPGFGIGFFEQPRQGTSQATAVHTGKLVYSLKRRK